ncbi:MAG: hypothetical protein A3G52_01110 [Candidatus Taylorbacteria bacterium RIFCSPLOWO2_12_FULL_43_20]|uniref:Tyrosine recombinase XerC n=1 Tax=Candidatus Taylorbacteria bacterium RIFCSPLOWO2_12_FULL_43_20 TaxID=1802332 RepID=A0A1G2P244_9BACT|nr:MAG: hypothetical protein A3E92_03230 [Candidatus Taylorbacteria bacterium RIFCSPHIGHO2_12_FULL_42_34]OHA31245.1 MAG: hypothetical protein A3B09_02155 [Candidatus Taylorbacteria bacterium RIFCSPLOWO2_01_FULL_43_83]OHA39065.1 MAG: hypothetical protein A3H58_01800 [Candidatus Taylorbacteria bacterium RIFCSPLOWO2_02_FULL_43_22b]OHA42416.1 MAG: hypothetical protein A3G52_01110 [Candidatus Taylorbacteria bacterium RIFCSPLOWO2_12_FULL_43_20]
MNLTDLKRQYLEHLEIEKGRSLKTIENYDRYLSRFFLYSKANKPSDITDESVRQYRLWLNRQSATVEKKTTLKKKTQNYYLIALRSFLKYLARREIKCMPAERIELAKTPERSLDLISHEELERLLLAPDKDNLKELRDKAMLELLFCTGLRVSELCSLPRDLDLNKDEFSVRGKGEKVRVVFLSEKARKAVKEYLSKRKDMSDFLFIKLPAGTKNNIMKGENFRLTPRSVERIVKFYAIKAGISKKVTPHTIRHSYATDLLQNGADIRSVQLLLGHANIGTTQIYTHITDRHLREIHKKFHNRK